MIRLFKQRRAIRSYVNALPHELKNRFGIKKFYSLAEVSDALSHAELDPAFSAFAHATYCSKSEFEEYYGQLKLKTTYHGLRRVVSKRFFNGNVEFDASSVVRAMLPAGDIGGYYESGIGKNI